MLLEYRFLQLYCTFIILIQFSTFWNFSNAQKATDTPKPYHPPSPQKFLETDPFLKPNAGRKLSGQACNPDLLRPCRFLDEACIGIPPKCMPKLKHEEPEYDYDDTDSDDGKKTTSHPDTNTDNGSQNSTDKTSRPGGSKPKKFVGLTVDPDDIDNNKQIEISTEVVMKGSLLWDGSTETNIPCLLNNIINEELNLNQTEDYKLQWAKDHSDEMCNFTNFQVCMEPEPEIELSTTTDASGLLPDPDPTDDPDDIINGVCRCVISSFVIIDKVCYIPAGLGKASTCGKEKLYYIPVPNNKGGFPTHEPSCVPHSECVTNPEYYGKRCRCKTGFKLIHSNHTCGSISNYQILNTLLILALYSIYFCH